MLKKRLDVVHFHVTKTFQSYFPPPTIPTLSVGAPSKQSYSPPHTPPSMASSTDSAAAAGPTQHLKLLLLGENDGRSTLVDLTKIFAQMAQQKKISVDDVSGELVDAEMNAAVMDEPDLLVLFGPRIELQGYPPWHIRLTEIL
jgi:dehydrodolichyl diphosphate syntase complex subunit NUS1